MVSKGLSFPAHEPRAFNGLALAYATANRGACHCESFSHKFEGNKLMSGLLGIGNPSDRFSQEGKGASTAKSQDLMTIFDSVAVCKFIGFGASVTPTLLAKWLTLTTGVDWTVEDLFKCGERIFNAKRMFNVKCGISRKDDTLPNRILNEPRGSGGAAENLPPLDYMLNDYYNYRGWNSEGIPNDVKLKELDIL